MEYQALTSLDHMIPGDVLQLHITGNFWKNKLPLYLDNVPLVMHVNVAIT
jgi:hypothetical protein